MLTAMGCIWATIRAAAALAQRPSRAAAAHSAHHEPPWTFGPMVQIGSITPHRVAVPSACRSGARSRCAVAARLRMPTGLILFLRGSGGLASDARSWWARLAHRGDHRLVDARCRAPRTRSPPRSIRSACSRDVDLARSPRRAARMRRAVRRSSGCRRPRAAFERTLELADREDAGRTPVPAVRGRRRARGVLVAPSGPRPCPGRAGRVRHRRPERVEQRARRRIVDRAA